MLSLQQLVEGVEELFLRALLAGEELDVVDQQRVERTVGGLELVHRVVLQRAHHVAHEALRMHVRNARFRVAVLDQVRDGVHQVRLAEAHAAVQEQRVVGAAGIFRHLRRRGLGQLVALAFDEGGEGKVGIEPRADHQPLGAAHAPGQCGGDGARGGAARADFHGHDGHVPGALIAQQLTDARQQVCVDPVDHEAVGRQELERAVALHGLQRPYPGIELLLRKLRLQRAHAASPKRRFHARCLRDVSGER